MDFSRKQISYFGLVATAVFLIGWFLSARVSGNWSYGKDTLSSLGYKGTSLGCALFNCVACMGSALFWAIEMILIIRVEKGRPRTYAAITLVAMIFLAGVGVADGRYGDIHLFFAFAYMGWMGISMIASTFTEFFRAKMIYPFFTAAMIIFNVICYFSIEFPMFEANAILLAILWSAMIGVAYGNYDGPNAKGIVQ